MVAAVVEALLEAGVSPGEAVNANAYRSDVAPRLPKVETITPGGSCEFVLEHFSRHGMDDFCVPEVDCVTPSHYDVDVMCGDDDDSGSMDEGWTWEAEAFNWSRVTCGYAAARCIRRFISQLWAQRMDFVLLQLEPPGGQLVNEQLFLWGSNDTSPSYTPTSLCLHLVGASCSSTSQDIAGTREWPRCLV